MYRCREDLIRDRYSASLEKGVGAISDLGFMTTYRQFPCTVHLQVTWSDHLVALQPKMRAHAEHTTPTYLRQLRMCVCPAKDLLTNSTPRNLHAVTSQNDNWRQRMNRSH